MADLPQPKRLRKGIAHNRAPKHEKDTARRYGGRLVRGSGCGSEKGDSRVEGLARIECKTTTHSSYRLTLETVSKIERAAMGAGEVPAIEVEFLDAKGAPKARLAIIPCWALETLIQRQKS